MEHKWKFEIYINGEWDSEYRLTAEEIDMVIDYINRINELTNLGEE